MDLTDILKPGGEALVEDLALASRAVNLVQKRHEVISDTLQRLRESLTPIRLALLANTGLLGMIGWGRTSVTTMKGLWPEPEDRLKGFTVPTVVLFVGWLFTLLPAFPV